MKKMKQTGIFLTTICIMFFAFSSCRKDGEENKVESPLVLGIDPDPGTGIVPSLAATYNFKVQIKSTPPANGVKIVLTAIRDSDNTEIISQTSQTNSAAAVSVNLQLNGLANGTLYNVKVVATSQNSSTNTATASFKIARK